MIYWLSRLYKTLITGVCVTLVSFLCLCGEEPAGNVSGSGSCAVWRKAHWPSFLSCLSHLKDCAHVRPFLSMFVSLSPKIRASQILVCGRCGLALWHTASLLISTGLWIPQTGILSWFTCEQTEPTKVKGLVRNHRGSLQVSLILLVLPIALLCLRCLPSGAAIRNKEAYGCEHSWPTLWSESTVTGPHQLESIHRKLWTDRPTYFRESNINMISG